MSHRRRPWLLYAGAAAAVLPALIAVRHVPGPVWAAAAALVTTLARVYFAASEHVWQLLAAGALVLVARVVLAAVRFVRLPSAARKYWLLARWHSLQWRRTCRALGLATIDKHQRSIRPVLFGTAAPLPRAHPARDKLRFPRGRFTPDPFGFRIRVKTVPGVGRAELDKAAPHLADALRCVRVSVSQPAPGRILLRGLRTDPLCAPVGPGILPVFDGRHLMLGRDELGELRRVDLANLSGSVMGGNPGRGKTESALSLAVQLTPSPLVEYYILDGGGGLDWSAFAAGAAAYVDDDLAAAEDMLLELHGKMTARRRNLVADLGVRNAWKRGPSPDYPLRWLLIEEAQYFFDLDAVKGDRARENRVRACRALVGNMLRRGRAPLHHTTMICQKPTGSSGMPPDLRDLAGLRWCFGVATIESAVAAVGDDIRGYETMSPTLLQGPEHVGVATALLPTGLDPYIRVKFPAIGDQLADRAAAAAARAAVPDDVRDLDPETAGA